MKAALIRRYGGVEEIVVEEMPEPRPEAGEVVVEVRCAVLNHLDIWVRSGAHGASLAKPQILGLDASGVIVALGRGVKGLQAGQEAVMNPGLSCGE